MLKGLGNFSSILKQAQQMGTKMQELNAKLKSHRATGVAGGGLVEAEVNGLGEMLRLSIDPSLLEKQDRELIEDLVPAAVNNALAKAKEYHAVAMEEITGGMDVPGLNAALKTITGQSSPDED